MDAKSELESLQRKDHWTDEDGIRYAELVRELESLDTKPTSILESLYREIFNMPDVGDSLAEKKGYHRCNRDIRALITKKIKEEKNG